jgi:hypothetical protein
MDGAESVNYMRALFGLLVCLIAGGVFTWVFPPDAGQEQRIVGLWLGSIQAAKRMYKGGTPSDGTLGRKIRLKVCSLPDSDVPLSERSVVEFGPDAALAMGAGDGDFVYVSALGWWHGGLRSIHATAKVVPDLAGTIRVPANHMEYGSMVDGRDVVVEKIM